MNEITIVNQPLSIKEYQGHRVVTTKDIDTLHERPKGTAGRNFRENKKHFVKDLDYFSIEITNDEIRRQFGANKNAGRELLLLTETGYLMLAKSLTDDLAWKVQRELINGYFRQQNQLQYLQTIEQRLQALEQHSQSFDSSLKANTTVEYPPPIREYFEAIKQAVNSGEYYIKHSPKETRPGIALGAQYYQYSMIGTVLGYDLYKEYSSAPVTKTTLHVLFKTFELMEPYANGDIHVSTKIGGKSMRSLRFNAKKVEGLIK